MNSIQKQTENSQQDNNTMNKKQELYKQQRKNSQHEGNQKIILDHPITSEVEEDKSFITPLTKEAIERLNSLNGLNRNNNNKEIWRLSTTDSMQEFLEIPDYIPNDDEEETDS